MKVKKFTLFSLVILMISFGNYCLADDCPENTYTLCQRHINNNSDETWSVGYEVSTGVNYVPGVGSSNFFDVGSHSQIAITYCAESGSGAYDATVTVMDSLGKTGTTPLHIQGTDPNGCSKIQINDNGCSYGVVNFNSPSNADITIIGQNWCDNPSSCLIGSGICQEGMGYLGAHPHLP